MGWKKLPYWLKGGIIGLIILLLLVLILSFIKCYAPTYTLSNINMVELYKLKLLEGKCTFNFENSLSNLEYYLYDLLIFKSSTIILSFLLICYSLLLGSLIGFIIGKIKSRK